jgi:glycosyltransferase involved in cell wall biosynthesis
VVSHLWSEAREYVITRKEFACGGGIVRIVLDATQRSHPMSGTDRIAKNVVKHLQEIDQENEYVVIVARKSALARELNAPNFETRVRRVFPGYWRVLEAPAQLGRLLLLKFKFRPHLFLAFLNLGTPVINPARKTLCFVFDLIPLRLPEHYLTNPILRWRFLFRIRRALRSTDRFLAISEFAKGELVSALQVAESSIDITPLGVETLFRAHMADEKGDLERLKQHGLEPGYVLTMGGWEPRKNVTAVMEAHQRLASHLRVRHPLVVAGGGKKFHIGPAASTEVRSLGPVSDDELASLYRHASVFVFASLAEGFGLPCLEAMASGTPVIASDRASLPEVVADAARMFRPDDSTGLAEILKELLTDSQEAKRLREKGLQRAASFSWQRTAECCLSSFESMHEGL